MRLILFLFLIYSDFSSGQPNAYVYGNHTKICISDTLAVEQLSNLSRISNDDVIFIFSGAGNGLTNGELDTLISFVESGGGLYIGAENWPLQTESNQITTRMFNKNAFGYYTAETAECAVNGNLAFNDLDTIPSGKTAVAFPMDHRLTVEAWVEDQPLLLTGNFGNGRIVIDGGYSRFYCDQLNNEGKTILYRIYQFLTGD